LPALTFWQEADDLTHFILETDLQNTVSFIDDQCSQVVEDEAFGVLQLPSETCQRTTPLFVQSVTQRTDLEVIEQSSRSGDE
jgi:hypothetical protein